jgi:hypothetical protein
MPFTISHVAAVMPAHRPLARLGVFTAAVIGSMTPDFAMLLPSDLARWQTHSLRALLTFCVPVGWCAYLLTRVLIKPALLEIMPDRAYVRLRAAVPRAGLGDVPHLFWVTAALLLGAFTHLVWDGFTHEDAHGVRMFPLLSDYELEMAGHKAQLYRWLQYDSSVLGLLVVGVALWVWMRHAKSPATPPPRRMRVTERVIWSVLYVALPAAVLTLAILQPLPMGNFPSTYVGEISRTAVAAMRALAVSLLLFSALIRLRLAI